MNGSERCLWRRRACNSIIPSPLTIQSPSHRGTLSPFASPLVSPWPASTVPTPHHLNASWGPPMQSTLSTHLSHLASHRKNRILASVARWAAVHTYVLLRGSPFPHLDSSGSLPRRESGGAWHERLFPKIRVGSLQ